MNLLSRMKNYLMGKEYPTLYSHTIEAVTKEGQSKYTFPDARFLTDKHIYGLFIRPQNSNGKRNSFTGKKLLNNNALGSAFLHLAQAGNGFIQEHPLEHFAHEWNTGKEPGSYGQIWVPKGFDPSSSYVRFSDDSDVSANESIEITFLYAPEECFA